MPSPLGIVLLAKQTLQLTESQARRSHVPTPSLVQVSPEVCAQVGIPSLGSPALPLLQGEMSDTEKGQSELQKSPVVEKENSQKD